jgi:hypothetical protein
MQQKRSSGAALKRGVILRMIMQANTAVPTIGIRMAKTAVGIPNNEAAAGEVNADSITWVFPLLVTQLIVLVAGSHFHIVLQTAGTVGAAFCHDLFASLWVLHNQWHLNQGSMHIKNITIRQ